MEFGIVICEAGDVQNVYTFDCEQDAMAAMRAIKHAKHVEKIYVWGPDSEEIPLYVYERGCECSV